MADLDISLCVWIWRWSLLCVLNKSKNRMSGILVPSKPWERRTAFGADHYPSCDKPHTCYTINMRGPTFMLVAHFTPKIKLITFLNERDTFSPLEIWRSGQHTRNRRCQDDLNTSFARWEYSKRNPFTQNTSLKRTHDTCNLAQRTPLAVQCSSSRTYCKFHVSMCQYMTELAQSSCLWVGSHAHCLYYNSVFMPTLCLKYIKCLSHI